VKRGVVARRRSVGLALCLALAACAGLEEDVDVRGPERRELYAAWVGGHEMFRVEAGRIAADSELERLWAEDLVVILVASYSADGVAAIGERHGRFERARRELIALGEVAVVPLVEMVLVGNNLGAKLATDLLADGEQRSAAAILSRAMGGAPERARMRALQALEVLSWAGEAEDAVVERLIAVLLRDPAWVCRAQAAQCLVARADAAGAVVRVRGALSQGLVDPEEAVVDAACGALLELGDVEAVPALVNHLERLVREGAGLDRLRSGQAALKGLTGTRRALAPAQWRTLWAEQREFRQR
jgi:hypothetical protein